MADTTVLTLLYIKQQNTLTNRDFALEPTLSLPLSLLVAPQKNKKNRINTRDSSRNLWLINCNNSYDVI